MNKQILDKFLAIPNDKNDKINYFKNLEESEENLEFLEEYALGKIQETLEEIEIQQMELEPIVSLSGKDSIIMLDIARRLKPDIKHIFSNTGIEWPSHVKFWKEYYPDLIWVNAKMSRRKTYLKYGSPASSKKIGQFFENVLRSKSYRSEIPKTMLRRIGGNFDESLKNVKLNFNIPKNKLHMLDLETFPHPYGYSAKCCDIFKGNVKHLKNYWTFVGTRIFESMDRSTAWRQTGCINLKKHQTTPLSLWPDWATTMYVDKYNILLPETYTKLNLPRTGCSDCPHGLDIESRRKPEELNRLEILHKFYYSTYYTTMYKFELKYTYLYMGVPVREDKEYMKELEVVNLRKEEWYKNIEFYLGKVLRINFDRVEYELPTHQLEFIANTYNIDSEKLIESYNAEEKQIKEK